MSIVNPPPATPQDIDLRIIEVAIEINGRTVTYGGGEAFGYHHLNIFARGIKFANANQNEAEVTIFNLSREVQDYLLTETSPFNLNGTSKLLTLYAGRESYATSLARIFVGNIVSAKLSQPPDIGITLRCLTGNYLKGGLLSMSAPDVIKLSTLSANIASDLGLSNNFQATDKDVTNYNFSGSAIKLIDSLGTLGNVDAYVDDDSLVVKNSSVPLTGPTKLINMSTGMVGIPDVTERGLRVKFLLDNQTKVGGRLLVESVMYPAVNGEYVIYKLGFEIATRDVPFYYIAEAKRLV